MSNNFDSFDNNQFNNQQNSMNNSNYYYGNSQNTNQSNYYYGNNQNTNQDNNYTRYNQNTNQSNYYYGNNQNSNQGNVNGYNQYNNQGNYTNGDNASQYYFSNHPNVGQNSYSYNGQNSYSNNGQNFGGNSYSTYSGAYGISASTTSVLAYSYLFMFIQIIVSLFAAFLAFDSGIGFILIDSRASWLLTVFTGVIIVMIAQGCIKKNNAVGAGICLFIYSAFIGVVYSILGFIFEFQSIFVMLVVAGIVFATSSAIGFFTKKNLSVMGQIGYMLIVGGIILTFINIIFSLDFATNLISIVMLAAFIGITAYDTQKIKTLASENRNLSAVTLGMYGGLEIYLDFINIFIRILALFGKRR